MPTADGATRIRDMTRGMMGTMDMTGTMAGGINYVLMAAGMISRRHKPIYFGACGC